MARNYVYCRLQRNQRADGTESWELDIGRRHVRVRISDSLKRSIGKAGYVILEWWRTDYPDSRDGTPGE